MHQFWNILLKCRYNFNPNTKKVLTGIRKRIFHLDVNWYVIVWPGNPTEETPRNAKHISKRYIIFTCSSISISMPNKGHVFFGGSIHPLLTYPKPNLLETFGQYIHKVPQKSLPVYFQGVWRGERTMWLQEPWISEALMSLSPRDEWRFRVMCWFRKSEKFSLEKKIPHVFLMLGSDCVGFYTWMIIPGLVSG